MSKVLTLWRNEMARIVKRTFVIVMLVIMIVLSFLIGGGIKIIDGLSTNDYYFADDAYIEDQIKEFDNNASAQKTKLDTLDPASAEYQQTLAELDNAASMHEYYKIFKEYDLKLYSNPAYIDDAAMHLAGCRAQTVYPMLETEETKQSNSATATECEAIITDKDYKRYIEWQKRRIESDTDYSADQKAIELSALDYRYAVDPDGEAYYLPEIEKWKSAKLGLINDRYQNDSGAYLPLTNELRDQLKNDIAVYEYKFEHGLANSSSDAFSSISAMAFSLIKSLCASFLLFLLLVLAGSGISSDIQSGAIKGLIIAPVKRSKIFFAKVLALLTVGIVGTLICAIVSVCAHGAFFGFGDLPVYVYAVGGTAHVLPGFVYLLAQLYTELIPSLMIAAFAMMMSALTRNTAVSVGISIAVYYLSGIAASFLMMGIITGEWTKFLPFLHMEIGTTMFPYASEASLLDAIGVSVTPSLTFSLVYLAIAIFTLGYTAFDSFTRRDI